MANTATVSKQLKALGLPVELVRGAGYHYFIFDDVDARNIYECCSVMVCRFHSYSESRWIELGKEFAAEVEAAHNEQTKDNTP